jgi:hypothetical protein
MWFKKQKKPFTPLPLDQLSTLTLPELKKYQQAHAKYTEDRLREIREQSNAQIQAMREQSDAQERASREQMRQEREQTGQQIQEIYEQGRAKMIQQQEETANLMKRAFNSPQYLEALSKTLEQRIQEENKHVIEAEILSSEEIVQPKAPEQ